MSDKIIGFKALQTSILAKIPEDLVAEIGGEFDKYFVDHLEPKRKK
jgi:hypothetical protein